MHIVEDMHWQFLDKISVSVIVLNLSKQIVYINKSMMEFIKYKQRDKLLNKPFNILNSIPLKIYSFITEIIEDGKTFNFVSEKLRVSHFNKIQEISINARKITQNKEIYIEFYLENVKTPQTNYKTNLGILRKDGFFFESFPNSIVLTDKDGYIIDCNQTTEKIFGLNQRDIIGKNYAELDLFTSEQISEFNKQIKKIVNGSNSKLIEMEVNRKDGKKIWIEFKCTLIKLDKNVLVETIFKDITEKKNTEQKLKSSEKKYRHLFERDPNALVLTDTKGNVLDCNPYAAKLAGYPKQEIIGKNYLDLGIFKERHKQIFAGRLKRFQAGERLEPIEILTINADGDTLWLKYQSSTINLDGQILIEAIIQDITEKKESELKLKESEEKFRVIAEQSLLGIAVLQDDVIKYVNQRYADILGYTIDEILAWRPMEYIKMIHPEFRDFMVEQATRKQNGSNDTVENYQFKAIKKDGDEIWCENYSRPIKYQGQFANLITTFEVTERKKAELIIKKEIKKLKELDNLRIDFVNRASHELKTPLTSIYGAIQLMNKFYYHELSDEALDILNIAIKGGKRLKKLVFNLLDISRIEARKLRLDKELSDLSSIIRNCVEEMKYLLQQRGLSLDLQIPEKCMIEIDKIRIEQVIYNLISNAIKNTPPGGNIYLKLRINNHVILSVKDTGVGLSKKEKRFLFEKFSKLERYGQGMNIITEGSGLGLFISKEIVELHRGKIWATSKGRNKGSTFFVTLPLS